MKSVLIMWVIFAIAPRLYAAAAVHSKDEGHYQSVAAKESELLSKKLAACDSQHNPGVSCELSEQEKNRLIKELEQAADAFDKLVNQYSYK